MNPLAAFYIFDALKYVTNSQKVVYDYMYYISIIIRYGLVYTTPFMIFNVTYSLEKQVTFHTINGVVTKDFSWSRPLVWGHDEGYSIFFLFWIPRPRDVN